MSTQLEKLAKLAKFVKLGTSYLRAELIAKITVVEEEQYNGVGVYPEWKVWVTMSNEKVFGGTFSTKKAAHERCQSLIQQL